MFFLAEVAYKPGANVVYFSHNVEQERFNVIKQRFMIKEHLREKTQVLAVDLMNSISKGYFWRHDGSDGKQDVLYFYVHPLQILIRSHLDKSHLQVGVSSYISSIWVEKKRVQNGSYLTKHKLLTRCLCDPNLLFIYFKQNSHIQSLPSGVFENSSGNGASYQVWISYGPNRTVRIRRTPGSLPTG